MLTDLQRAQTRHWMGYPAFGTDSSVAPYLYMAGITRSHELDVRLSTLTPVEESILVGTYLTPLATLETAILGAQDNMDTQSAGPWTANPREVQNRTSLFNQWCRGLCAFLGFDPGPGLSSGAITLVRA